jgi:glyoxylase-like metal-dependent hydrolase (beta-lactamase superfamily II)
MWIQTPGAVNERLMLLGTRDSILYLVKGDRHVLIGGGGMWIVPELERQFSEYRVDMDRIQYLLIGHTHYDHCGAVPYLQRRYPHLRVMASRQAAKVFAMDKALRNIRTFSHQAMQDLRLPLEFDGVSLEFDKIDVARALQDGDSVDLGSGLSLDVFETPGHSRCSMTLFEPEEKWLFPSDSMAVPVGNGDTFMCTASDSFIVYLNSLKKLTGLGARLCAWEHLGVMTEEHALDIVPRVMRYTLKYKRGLVEHVRQTRDVEKTARWAARDWLTATGIEFSPFEVMLHTSSRMVKNALEEQVSESDYL